MVIDLPLYTVTITGSATADAVTLACAVLHKFDPRPGGVDDPKEFASCLVVAGGLGGDAGTFPMISTWGGPYTPHTASQVVDGWTSTQTYTLVRSAESLLLPAGDVTFHFRVFTQDETDITHADLVVTLPARPLPSLKTNKIARSLFKSDPAAVQQADEVQAFKDAGVNCLEYALFRSPADGFSSTGGLAEWQANMTTLVLPTYQWCRDNGFLLFLTGDDFFRNTAEKDWVKNTSWAHDAVVWLIQQVMPFADVIVGIEMQDEAPDTSTDPAYQLVIDWIREVWPAAPMAWPNQNRSGLVMPDEVSSRATYASRYQDTDGVLLYHSASAGEMYWSYSNCTKNVPAGWPLVVDFGGSGNDYFKGGPGQDYNPATDTVARGGVRASDVVAQIWTALAFGVCDLRGYYYDYPTQRDTRLQAALGSLLGTGIRPGDERWPGLSAGFNAVASREAKLLSGYRPPVRQGPFLLGFRDGLSWAVNLSSRTETCSPGTYRLVSPSGEAAFPGGDVPSGCVVIWDGP